MKSRERLERYLITEFGCKPGEAKTHAAHIMGILKYSRRSIQQNNYYWGVIIHMTTEFYAYDSEQEMHDAWGVEFRTEHRQGKPPRVKSTTEMSTVEFEEYLERIRRRAAVDGCYVPEPNEI